MDRFDIYQQIAERTNGDIYIGVVGPVRTGKSTFIKRFIGDSEYHGYLRTRQSNRRAAAERFGENDHDDGA